MDHELKQRLIGAVVITALAAIFIPMLFDDPVDTSGKEVTELKIPPTPPVAAPETAQNLPQNKEQVINRTEVTFSDLKVTEEDDAAATGLDSQTMPENNGAETPVTAESTNAAKAAGLPGQTLDSTKAPVAAPNEKAGLDTGYIDGNDDPQDTQSTAVKPMEPIKTPKQTLKPVESQPEKTVSTHKTKTVTSTLKEKPVEKPKQTAKSEGNKSAKTGSKLARYSLQAGSFNKKENAEALAAKLRKQGLPATISSKGEYFRVKVGPTLDKAKAKDMKTKLEKLNINGLIISE
ncbi:MAG: hypothetical protein FJ190_06165 [Gammaproteobacteria bacterium]|nr:hypothetical protein [Gammaproteobacteria bacterium]